MPNTEYTWIPTVLQGIGIVVTGSFSFLLYKLHRKRNSDDTRLQKPLVNVHNFKDMGYVIVNIGKGPALNIRFAERDRNRNWQTAYIGYSIPVNTFFKTKEFFNHYGAIAVAYNDLLGNDYLMITDSDTSTIFERGDEKFDEELFKKLHTGPKRTDKMPLSEKL